MDEHGLLFILINTKKDRMSPYAYAHGSVVASVGARESDVIDIYMYACQEIIAVRVGSLKTQKQ